MKTAAGALYLLLTLNSAFCVAFLQNYTNASNGVSLTAGFVPDKLRISIGEPTHITFLLTNNSSQLFQFSHVRNEIFTITATNASGQPVKTRYFGLDANGFVSQEKIAPGKGYSRRIFFNERCQFEQPGDYEVTCRCDFSYFGNLTNSLGRPIVTVFRLAVVPSTPERTTEIIATWATAVKTNGPPFEIAQALAEISDARTVPPLAALISRDPGNYIAVDAIARFTNDEAADALLPVLRHGEDYVAGIASKSLRASHQNDRLARVLIPGLGAADPEIRIETARAIGWTGAELAFEPLKSLLHDPTSSVRYAAAEAIGRLGSARSCAALTNCLTDPDFALRIAAVNGLRALGGPLQSEWLTPIIKAGGENVRTFYQAIDLLRIYGGDQAAPGLASCLHFDDPSVKNGYNFRLILALEFSPNGPKYYYKWHHDPNRDGTPEELAENRQILSAVRDWLVQHQ